MSLRCALGLVVQLVDKILIIPTFFLKGLKLLIGLLNIQDVDALMLLVHLILIASVVVTDLNQVVLHF